MSEFVLEEYVKLLKAFTKKYREGNPDFGVWTTDGILYGDGTLVPHQDGDSASASQE